MDQKELWKFIHTMYNVSGRIHQIRNMEVPMSIGISANSAMLYTLNIINNNPDLKMSEISLKMGLTKGAISQMAQKLEKNGLIEKNRSENSSKDIFMKVTERGKQALKEYNEVHDNFYDGINEVINQYPEQDEKVISEFMGKLDQFLEDYKDKLKK